VKGVEVIRRKWNPTSSGLKSIIVHCTGQILMELKIGACLPFFIHSKKYCIEKYKLSFQERVEKTWMLNIRIKE